VSLFATKLVGRRLDTAGVHSQSTVDQVLALCLSGVSTREVAQATGIPESTIGHWRRGDRRKPGPRGAAPCPRCHEGTLGESYSYLLGAYLGDGHITRSRRDVHALSVFCSDDYPGIMDDVETAMHSVLAVSVCRVRRTGCTQVKSYSKHWPCLFPQHGPGMKHTRPIVLTPWQNDLVDQHTGAFLRGLFHSDGCRMTNWVRRTVAGVPKRYEYPRWFFTNKSDDILGLCSAALDRVGIAHRFPRRDTISVARREAVAALDLVVGPKS
jgi:hypothetical protein